jgi:hypothetical protein
MDQAPLLAVNDTILWLKVILSAATIILLYLRYRKGKTSAASPKTHSSGTTVAIGLAVVLSFGVFHNLGTMRAGTFVHYADMFHYYLGAKYFKELGYFELYNAVIIADAEQGNELARLPFYTDLRTYQNAPREKALEQTVRVKGVFSEERWVEFKDDVAYFKQATGGPSSPGVIFLLMDHGYNGSPISTFILGVIANIVPVAQLSLLASLDVLLVVAMGALVFRTFGFEMGSLFSVYFCINLLNPYDYISGAFLRYDWLFYIVVSVCLLERGRYASSAFFLTLSAMIRVFPAVLFYGMAVIIFKNVKATRAVDKKYVRFVLAAGATATVLFFLPAATLGSALQPWKEFADNIAIHDSGVYVNHLGLRGVALFEPSHLSLDRFAEAFKSTQSDDIVRNWQDIKEAEYKQKKPAMLFASLLVLICLTTIIWKRESETESVLWPLVLVYAASYPSHYYYAFLCLFVLLFFKRPNSLHALVPLCLLLALNIGTLVTDYCRPSPIVFYTLVNIYLFAFVILILGFELYVNAREKGRLTTAAIVQRPAEAGQDGGRRERRRPSRARRK